MRVDRDTAGRFVDLLFVNSCYVRHKGSPLKMFLKWPQGVVTALRLFGFQTSVNCVQNLPESPLVSTALLFRPKSIQSLNPGIRLQTRRAVPSIESRACC